MPCHTEQPERTWEDHLEFMLCGACSFLTPEQMMKIMDNSGYIGLYEWYSGHLLQDYAKNYDNEFERNKYEKLAERIGRKLIKEKDGLFKME